MNKRTTTKASLLMAAASTGLIATSDAAIAYIEGPDLSNDSGTPTLLTSGTNAVDGTANSSTDNNDYFTIDSLVPGASITFDYNFLKSNNSDSSFNLTFTNPDTSATLFTVGSPEFSSPIGKSGTTTSLTVPDSGKILISAINSAPFEGGSTTTSWGISTDASNVPEPSGPALLALGSLLALRRKRNQ